jgi:hypothetical protein
VVFRLACVVASGWILTYVLYRCVQPYPLDAFEEYQIQKANAWLDGKSLYGTPEETRFPEAYPPLYFWVLGPWLRLFGESFVAARLLSLAALAGIVGCGSWALRDATAPRVARLAFVTVLLSLHPLTAKFYEVAKPDGLLTMFLAFAIVTGEHRTWAEVLASSGAMLLASLTKQNAPLFVVPLCVAHAVNGRWRWGAVWGATMAVCVGASYVVLDWSHEGNFNHWVFHWTAGHGVSLAQGFERTLRTIVFRAPVLLILLAGSLMVRPRCRFTWCLVCSLAIGFMGMSKSGGIANHFMPAAFVGAVIVAEWLAGWLADRAKDEMTRSPGMVARSAPTLTHRVRVPSWLGRCAAFAVLGAIVWPGLPARRDFRWVAQRRDELADWTHAIRRLEGRVAVSHHGLIARNAGAESFFSDLILQFPGLAVPDAVRRRIRSQEFDYLVLVNDPRECPTAEWARLIAESYEFAGGLEFRDRSALLPRRVYKARGQLDSKQTRRVSEVKASGR